MNIKKIILLLVILAYGCQSLESPKEPSIVIEEDKMVDILTEIALLKAAKGSFKKKMEIEKINPEAYILQTYGIDSITFAENNAWYARDLKNYEKIFTEVKSAIELDKNELEKQQKERDSLKKVNDSLKKAQQKNKEDSLKGAQKDIIKELTKKNTKDLKSIKPTAKYVSEKKQQFP